MKPGIVMPETGKGSGRQTLVLSRDGNYYVVSTAFVPYTGAETMTFLADSEGDIVDWTERDCYRPDAHEAAIERAIEGYFDYFFD